MKWPRGKYNGMKIQGFGFKIRIKLLDWTLKPRYSWSFGEPYFAWLFFIVNFNVEFKRCK